MKSDDYSKYLIKDITEETSKIRTFEFDREIDAKPGQFVMAWIPGVSSNPYSVAKSIPFWLTIKKMGDKNSFSSKAFEMDIGDELYISEPRGNSFLDFLKEEVDQFFLAGGYGSIPLAPLAEIMDKKPQIIMLGAETREKILYEKRFKENSKNVKVTTDDGSYGLRGQITDLLQSDTFIDPGSQFFVCGPNEMLDKSGEILTEKGVDEDNIIMSVNRYMKCGKGGCGSCGIGEYRACVDGPVFSYEQIKDGLKYKRGKSGRIEYSQHIQFGLFE